MFEDLNNEQRKLVKEALDIYADLQYDKDDLDKMKEAESLLEEL